MSCLLYTSRCVEETGVYKVILHKGYFAVLHAEVLTLLDFLSAEHAVTCGKRDLSRMNLSLIHI